MNVRIRPEHDADATYKRVRAATCEESGLSDEERDAHIRQVTVTVMEARVRGPLAAQDRWVH